MPVIMIGAMLAVGVSIRVYYTKAHCVTSQPAVSPLTSLPARLQGADGEIVVPAHTLQNGDIVMVSAGEIIPLDGLIISGRAWISPPSQPHNPAMLLKGFGEEVHANQVVMLGSIRLTVRRALIKVG